jgi:hypothetical protein
MSDFANHGVQFGKVSAPALAVLEAARQAESTALSEWETTKAEAVLSAFVAKQAETLVRKYRIAREVVILAEREYSLASRSEFDWIMRYRQAELDFLLAEKARIVALRKSILAKRSFVDSGRDDLSNLT